ncbi:MAG: hypothetical protein MZU97_05890 [Bacillus subtilis]|nr:hypothetical protein [Bacillus subtilis]
MLLDRKTINLLFATCEYFAGLLVRRRRLSRTTAKPVNNTVTRPKRVLARWMIYRCDLRLHRMAFEHLLRRRHRAAMRA